MSGSGQYGHTIEALRDFFLAVDASDIQASYDRLACSAGGAPPVDSWCDLEFAFNRLFVGPGKVAAPPYASVYLDGQSSLMGESTVAVRHLYHALGLQSPWEDSLPDDHVGLELDALYRMGAALGEVQSDELREALFFLHRHMGQWVPLFKDRIWSTPEVPEPIRFVASLLERIASDCRGHGEDEAEIRLHRPARQTNKGDGG